MAKLFTSLLVFVLFGLWFKWWFAGAIAAIVFIFAMWGAPAYGF